MMRSVLLAALLSSAPWLHAAHPPDQTELSDIMLGQRASILASLGEAFHAQRDAHGGVVLSYHLGCAALHVGIEKESQSAAIIMVSLFSSDAVSCPKAGSLLGISIGSRRADLLRVFGIPERTARNSDGGKTYDFVEYQGKNYSFELTLDGRVRSIQILRSPPTKELPEISPPTRLDTFQRAVEMFDREALMSLLAPDVEIFRGKDLFRFEGPAGRDLREHQGIRDCLYGKRSVREHFKRSRRRPDDALRLVKGQGASWVQKFSGDGLLSEIVWTQVGDDWRIWEVRFR